MSNEYITTYRYYRNLLKACRVLGVDDAFEEFDTPDVKYLNVFISLAKTDGLYDLFATTGDYKNIAESKYMRNVLHSYQAKYEKDQIKRQELIALWDYISVFQTIKRQIWFWE